MKITSVTIAVSSNDEVRALMALMEAPKPAEQMVWREVKSGDVARAVAVEDADDTKPMRGKNAEKAADDLIERLEGGDPWDDEAEKLYARLPKNQQERVDAVLTPPEEEPEPEPEEEVEEPEEAPVSRRRRRAEPEETEEDEGNDDAPTAARSRRRRSAEAGDASSRSSSEEDQDDDGEQAPPRRRRRAEPEEDEGNEDTAGDTGRSRRRSAGDAEKTDKISDEDLAKAASRAAKEITPAVVKQIIREFGVDTVNDIPQDQRRKFLDELEAEIAAG